MVQTVSILERLARREREARAAVDLRETRAANVRNVHLSDEAGEPDAPAGVDAAEWASWGEEARYVLLERLGVGDELGMAEADALRLAVVEARMVQAGNVDPSAREDAPHAELDRIKYELGVDHLERTRRERSEP